MFIFGFHSSSLHPISAWIPAKVTTGISLVHQAAMDFMVWNSFLAFVPLVLALTLYARKRQAAILLSIVCAGCLLVKAPSVLHGLSVLSTQIPDAVMSAALLSVLTLVSILLFKPEWRSRIAYVVGSLAFMVFLPNAPYVLTDILHLVETARVQPSMTVMMLAVVPLYTAYVLIGFSAYVLSLTMMSQDLHTSIPGRSRRTVEYVVHALCAIGIYLGRFDRWNSWDVAARPWQVIQSLVNAFSTPSSLAVIVLSFIIIVLLFELWRMVLRALSREMRHLPRLQRLVSSRQF